MNNSTFSHPDFEEGIFYIDGFKGNFKGINPRGVRWNGWHCPYFTLDVAKRVLKCQDTKENSLNDGQQFYEFNEDFTALICHFEDGGPGRPLFDFNIENSIQINGVNYFAIGYYNWVWEKKRKVN
jgi:hypothetical protein